MSKGRKRPQWELLPQVHPNAAGLDIGAREIWACVPSDRDPEPVRHFGTFTPDLLALVDWLMGCGIDTVAMEAIPSRCARGTNGRGILDPSVRTARSAWPEGLPGQCPPSQTGAGTHIVPMSLREVGLSGLPVDPEVASAWAAGGLVPPGRRDVRVAQLSPASGTASAASRTPHLA
ncbi:MAG: hypothetical protein A2Z21_05850 [Candidatus Fraserbacteria bacterium RBG_16_55_9]|uniref:Uncharacterized protein n=1 Tax=Fraserbacteria sp. (strain RBG_16_55_9) TaxID=1817864 RepID=A0A1F5V2D0_FRAXR|nr:MAG: hypothetical protein A2Z21_05850 [Candidatus Fraserbacteria bacterium RBG_16_55_9]